MALRSRGCSTRRPTRRRCSEARFGDDPAGRHRVRGDPRRRHCCRAAPARRRARSSRGRGSGRAGPATTRRTLLHVASEWPGHYPNGAATVAALIDAGADVNASFVGRHSEDTAALGGKQRRRRSARRAAERRRRHRSHWGGHRHGTPLADAVAFGQWNAARRLIERARGPRRGKPRHSWARPPRARISTASASPADRSAPDRSRPLTQSTPRPAIRPDAVRRREPRPGGAQSTDPGTKTVDAAAKTIRRRSATTRAQLDPS